MHARRLLGLAAESLPVPYGPASPAQVDAVLLRAGRIRRRRRLVLVAGSAAAVAAVAVGAALVPRADGGRPALGGAAASGPPSASALPSPSGGSASPSPSTTPSASASDPAGVHATGAEVEPSTPATTRTTAVPKTSPATTSKAPASPSGAPSGAALDPAKLVASLLPAGSGSVRREPDPATPSYKQNPLSGRYLLTKDGKTAYLDITVVDIKVNPDQQRLTMAQERASDHCTDGGIVPPNTDCARELLPDGSLLSTWSSPGNQQEPGSGHVSGPGHAAVLIDTKGNHVEIYACSGITGTGGYGPRYDQPPLTAAQLATLVQSPAWLRSS